MKRFFIFSLLLFTLIMFTGCVSDQKYNELQDELYTCQNNLDTANSNLDTANNNIDEANNTIEDLNGQIDDVQGYVDGPYYDLNDAVSSMEQWNTVDKVE